MAGLSFIRFYDADAKRAETTTATSWPFGRASHESSTATTVAMTLRATERLLEIPEGYSRRAVEERPHDGIRDLTGTRAATRTWCSQVLQHEFGEVDRVSERDVASEIVRVLPCYCLSFSSALVHRRIETGPRCGDPVGLDLLCL